MKPKPNRSDAPGVSYIDDENTDLLRKFISERGKIRGRRVTRLAQQRRQLTRAIKNAREMALSPYAAR
ncbi:30S ribosomal protein S18 [Streptomyces sp. NPDC057702]|uniref:30S ribosomal protein S18 n=1 Tax=unclassified Streptomyces TaxID=2593676 RepID=UPI003689DFB5